MKKWSALTVAAIVLASAAGCSLSRAIEQWKCDNLGWCCFGTRPSAPPCGVPAYPAATCAPACPSACPPACSSGCPQTVPGAVMNYPGATAIAPAPATTLMPVQGPAVQVVPSTGP